MGTPAGATYDSGELSRIVQLQIENIRLLPAVREFIIFRNTEKNDTPRIYLSAQNHPYQFTYSYKFNNREYLLCNLIRIML